MGDDLAKFLRPQLDEDERIAQEAGNRRWLAQDNIIELYPEREDDGFMSWPTRSDARHAANWDPARVLREIDARRRELALHQAEPGQHPDFCGYDRHELPCPSQRLLALPYADRPGYRQEWRP